MIPRATAAMVFNDMINANIRGGDVERTRLVVDSGLLDRAAHLATELRRLQVPIIWIRVGRRADRKDRVDVLTDAFIAGGRKPARPTVKGSFESENVAELPPLPEDHEVMKPRIGPFVGTDLDIQLRARGINTILLGGIATNMGVESCARSAFDLDYNVVVIRDCCWAPSAELHEFSLTKSLPNFARVMTAEQAVTLLR